MGPEGPERSIAMDEEDDVYQLVRKEFSPVDPLKIPAEVLPRVIELVKESAALSKVIDALGERLAAGENSVRAELNPAIRRRNELGHELFELKQRYGLLGPPIMYGPPWSFGRDE